MTTLKQLLDLLSNYEILEIHDNDKYCTNDEIVLYYGSVRVLLNSELYKKYENENVFQIMASYTCNAGVYGEKLIVLLDLSKGE